MVLNKQKNELSQLSDQSIRKSAFLTCLSPMGILEYSISISIWVRVHQRSPGRWGHLEMDVAGCSCISTEFFFSIQRI